MINKIKKYLTIFAFLLIPILSYIRYTGAGFRLEYYGKGAITRNSILILLFGVLCFITIAVYLINAYNYWKEDNPSWKKEICLAYCLTLLLCLSVAFIVNFQSSYIYGDACNLLGRPPCPGPTSFYLLVSLSDRLSGLGLIYLLSAAASLLFPVGLFSLALGFISLRYRNTRSRQYFYIVFSGGMLLMLLGAIPFNMVAIFWIDGGVIWHL